MGGGGCYGSAQILKARAKSNMFAMSDQSQTQKFKEAFNVIDQNRDGFIVKEDLHDMLASLGKNPTDEGSNWRGKDRDLTPSESRGMSWNDTEGQSQLCSRPRGQQFGLNQGGQKGSRGGVSKNKSGTYYL
uniref:EF-hand domain-containing protein n=1 Tax=Felis catus TaxID=9685 RepID=A0ABI8AMG7_FELCA